VDPNIICILCFPGSFDQLADAKHESQHEVVPACRLPNNDSKYEYEASSSPQPAPQNTGSRRITGPAPSTIVRSPILPSIAVGPTRVRFLLGRLLKFILAEGPLRMRLPLSPSTKAYSHYVCSPEKRIWISFLPIETGHILALMFKL
jgi:hypothetical protein